jgi:hypothetical protein
VFFILKPSNKSSKFANQPKKARFGHFYGQRENFSIRVGRYMLCMAINQNIMNLLFSPDLQIFSTTFFSTHYLKVHIYPLFSLK